MSALLSLLGIGSGVSWIVYAVVFGLGVSAGATPAYVWEHRAVTAAEAEKHEAQTKDVYHEADASRWVAASGLRDKAIDVLNGIIAKQNASIDAAKLDNTKLNTINARYAAELRTARDTATAQEQETRNDARQRPAEVHHLGAVACAQYRRLYGDAAACTDTGAALAPGS